MGVDHRPIFDDIASRFRRGQGGVKVKSAAWLGQGANTDRRRSEVYPSYIAVDGHQGIFTGPGTGASIAHPPAGGKRLAIGKARKGTTARAEIGHEFHGIDATGE